MNNKEVLVIPQYDSISIGDKFTKKIDLNTIISNSFFVSRDLVKGNNLIREIIPYVVYEHKNKYLVGSYTVGNVTKKCLGIYKHIYNNGDFSTVEKYILDNFEVKKIKFIGFVKDNKKYAGYIGCIFLSKDKDFRQKIKNGTCESYKWKSKRELINEYGSFESWSRYIIDEYIL